MDYLKEIKPLYQYVTLYLEGKGVPNHEKLLQLSEIEFRLKQSERVAMYGNSKAEVYPTDIGCHGCVKAMMVNLQRWYKIKTDDSTVPFKGVPQKDATPKLSNMGSPDCVDPSTLKWPKFKTYCKEQGLNVKGKTKAVLLEELKGL